MQNVDFRNVDEFLDYLPDHERIIVDYLVREGHFKSAKKMIEELENVWNLNFIMKFKSNTPTNNCGITAIPYCYLPTPLSSTAPPPSSIFLSPNNLVQPLLHLSISFP